MYFIKVIWEWFLSIYLFDMIQISQKQGLKGSRIIKNGQIWSKYDELASSTLSVLLSNDHWFSWRILNVLLFLYSSISSLESYSVLYVKWSKMSQIGLKWSKFPKIMWKSTRNAEHEVKFCKNRNEHPLSMVSIKQVLLLTWSVSENLSGHTRVYGTVFQITYCFT